MKRTMFVLFLVLAFLVATNGADAQAKKKSKKASTESVAQEKKTSAKKSKKSDSAVAEKKKSKKTAAADEPKMKSKKKSSSDVVEKSSSKKKASDAAEKTVAKKSRKAKETVGVPVPVPDAEGTSAENAPPKKKRTPKAESGMTEKRAPSETRATRREKSPPKREMNAQEPPVKVQTWEEKPAPKPRETPREGVNRSEDKVIGKDEKGRTIYEGPRGGQYYLTETGSKVYVTRKKP